MTEPKSMLVTSEMMQAGIAPLLFTGGASNIQGPTGPMRNPGPGSTGEGGLMKRAGPISIPKFIHRLMDAIISGESMDHKRRRPGKKAKLRVYEITATTIAAVTMLEIMDDARRGRKSIVWFNEGKTFAPIGLGDRDEIMKNAELRQEVGEMVYSHLVAYVNAGRQLRYELTLMLADCSHIIFANSFDELKAAIFLPG